MSNEEEKRCPLCAEEMDWTDIQLKPCKCGYQVCVWCWHHLIDVAEKDGTEGRCPACRTPYDKEKIVQMQANCERAATANSNRKSKPTKLKTKPTEVKRDLTNVRVIQRKMAYIIGLPLSLADEDVCITYFSVVLKDLLRRKEYFGQYGKITKVSLSRTAGGAVQEFINETCSVYVTYSKEEEALRCIQSVHGFMLEGRFLRASFGTAKYCHAWLRNMPCNNSSCLYLHSVGAEEDSFGKDEVAAVHTRNRVQQVVGAAHILPRRSGNVLPSPMDENFNSSSLSVEISTSKSVLKDAAYALAALNGHSNSSLLSRDRDGDRVPNKMTTFVDVVGQSSSFGSDRDVNISEDGRFLNLCSELSSVAIEKNKHSDVEHPGVILHEVTSSSPPVSGLLMNSEFREPPKGPSNFLVLKRADLTRGRISITKEQSSSIFDSGRRGLHGPYGVLINDKPSFDGQRLVDLESLSQKACGFPLSYSAKISEDSSDNSWQHRYSSAHSNSDTDCEAVSNQVDGDYAKFLNVNSMLNDGYSERKFQSSAKSDRIYRNSNSFSNEEIVEHLRRVDDNTLNDSENFYFDAIESNIISNILSIDFDASDEPFTVPRASAESSERNNGCYGSWNVNTRDQSRFSFVDQDPFEGCITDPDAGNSIGHLSKKASIFHNSTENEPYLLSRTQNLIAQGISVPPREPPPGFSASKRTNPVIQETSGSHLIKGSSPCIHYRTSSTGKISNSSDDFSDSDLSAIGYGISANGFNKSSLEIGSTSKPSIFEDESRLWLLMQQATPTHQDSKLSHVYMQQQASSTRQESRYSGHSSGPSSLDDYYGASKRLMDQHNTYNPTSFSHLSQQKYANGHLSNSYHLGSNEVPRRSEVSMAELQRNGGLEFSSLYSGYGDSMFQMPSSGDVYNRVFGM